ncbi:Gfo/Idh/MocA family protein [Pseudomonas sp. NY15435]|uniref:Gfo/Idh/MocA family protein n=1 Tax=Pseudomonas sp. NY15435 TaxID=3400358 RepID=UPI003A8543C3
MSATLYEPLRVAVVGLGKMGRLHCSAWQRIPDVRLTTLVECDARQAAWATTLGLPCLDSAQALVGKVDVAVIATPSDRHVDSALPLLEAGIHCLVEKPLALTFSECRQLVEAGRRCGALLAVGHSERFNPALHLARSALSGHVPCVEVIRAAPAAQGSQRSDSDVVQDLMIHDIDWLLDTLGTPDDDVRVLEWRRQEGQLSHVRCQLTFADGRRVNLTACRESTNRQRHVRLYEGDVANRVIDLDVRYASHEPDALTRQAQAFLMALRGEPSPIALGNQALQAVLLGERIRNGCRVGEAVL